MKTRICILFLLGALVLASFEIWRYRAANKNFKYLFEAKSAEQTAFFSALRVYNSLLIAIQDAGLFNDKLYFGANQVFPYSVANYDQTSIYVGAACQADFFLRAPLNADDINKIELIAKQFKDDLPRNWRIKWEQKEGTVQFLIYAESQSFSEPWSRFPHFKK